MKPLEIGLLVWALAGGTGAAQAADLFESNKLRSINAGDPLPVTDTIGGYAVYPGEGQWTFDNGKSEFVVGPSAIWMGAVTMVQRRGSTLVAWQTVRANLNRSLDTVGWRGGPCGSEHLVKKRGRSGNSETCLTIDPNVNNAGSRSTMYLGVGITHTAARGRYQQIYIALNAELLGFRDTGPGDWSEAGLQSKPRRREFIERLTVWAEQLQASAGKAFEANEPGDFYTSTPSYMSLMPANEELRGKEFSLSFMGAVEDMKDKDGFKAIAYSKTAPGETRWANTWSHATQDDANKRALENCERERAASRPPCQLLDFK